MKSRVLILTAVLCIPGIPSAGERTPRVPGVANDLVHSVEAVDPDTWSVMLLADVQDGFTYVPQLLDAATRAGVQAVVIAGDLARGDGGHHLDLIARELRMNPAEIPIFVVPGNHDCITHADRRRFSDLFGSTGFEFRIGGTRFIGMDSTQPERERESLRRALDSGSRGEERTILVRHHPLGPGQGTRPGDVELRSAAVAHGVDLVVSGHGHTETFENQDDTWFLVLPSSGDRDQADRSKPVSYVILRSTPSGVSFATHRIPRSWLLDLRAAVTHILIAHLAPTLTPTRLILGTLALALVAVLLAARRLPQLDPDHQTW